MSDLTMTQLEELAGSHSTRQASEVKANWRSIVQEAREKEVIVTNYNRPEAVVMSAERYAELKAAVRANDPLQHLRAEFDRELASLHSPAAGQRLREVFDATQEELARAANAVLDDNE